MPSSSSSWLSQPAQNRPPPPFLIPSVYNTAADPDQGVVSSQFDELDILSSTSSSSSDSSDSSSSTSTSTTTTTTTTTSSSSSTSIFASGWSGYSSDSTSTGSFSWCSLSSWFQWFSLEEEEEEERGRSGVVKMGGPLDMTVPQLLKHWADHRPDWPALVFRDPNSEDTRTVLTFKDLYVLGGRCAAILSSRGLHRQSVILVLLPNSPERAVLEAAAILMGAFTVSVPPCMKADCSELVSLAKRLFARAVVLDPELHWDTWQTLRGLCQLYDPVRGSVSSAGLPSLHLVLMVRRISPPNEVDFLCYLRDVCNKEHRMRPDPYPHHPCVVLSTVGRGGGRGGGGEEEEGARSPKLVLQSHRNVVAFSKLFLPKTDSPRPSYFLNYPFGSVRGHLAVSLCNPVTRILLDERASAPECVATAIHRVLISEKCPVAALTPSVVPRLAELFRDDVLQDFRLTFVGFIGEEVSSEVMSSVLQFSRMAMVSYVSAELLLVAVSVLSEDALDLDRPWGCGRPIQPGIFVSTADGQGNVLPSHDTAGQLLIRSPLLFQGYLNDPKSTAASLTKDGYFKTGDVGQLLYDHLVVNNKN